MGAVHGVAKSRTRLSAFTFTFHSHALEKGMAPHSSVLAWRIPGPRSHHLFVRFSLLKKLPPPPQKKPLRQDEKSVLPSETVSCPTLSFDFSTEILVFGLH